MLSVFKTRKAWRNGSNKLFPIWGSDTKNQIYLANSGSLPLGPFVPEIRIPNSHPKIRTLTKICVGTLAKVFPAVKHIPYTASYTVSVTVCFPLWSYFCIDLAEELCSRDLQSSHFFDPLEKYAFLGYKNSDKLPPILSIWKLVKYWNLTHGVEHSYLSNNCLKSYVKWTCKCNPKRFLSVVWNKMWLCETNVFPVLVVWFFITLPFVEDVRDVSPMCHIRGPSSGKGCETNTS